MEPSEAAAVSGDPSVGVVVALGDEGACDNAADDIEDVQWASDDDADAWVGSVNSRSDDSDCAEDDSSVPDVARPRVRTRSSAPSPSEGRYEKQRRVLVRVRLKRPVQVVKTKLWSQKWAVARMPALEDGYDSASSAAVELMEPPALDRERGPPEVITRSFENGVYQLTVEQHDALSARDWRARYVSAKFQLLSKQAAYTEMRRETRDHVSAHVGG